MIIITILGPCQRMKKNTWNMKVTVKPIVVGALGTIFKGLIKGLDELEIRGRAENIQIKIAQSTEKSPGDLR